MCEVINTRPLTRKTEIHRPSKHTIVLGLNKGLFKFPLPFERFTSFPVGFAYVI